MMTQRNFCGWGMILSVWGTLGLAALVRAEEIDTRPLPLEVAVAFENVSWTGWEAVSSSGAPTPIRPILVTHAGDKSGRLFVPTQQGVIYTINKTDDAQEATVFLDITEKVSYQDKTNEEGFLGLAFHPRFKENGEFFVYYTDRQSPHRNVVARYRTKKGGVTVGDQASEEILLTMKKPFWNHDGGTICFGPDGMLYIAVGDGGAGSDPFGNGQSTKTLLGKIHRIDVDHKDDGLAYAIPKDNPFAGKEDGTRGEIYAYGLRNVWRMAFDRKTGLFWGADVGQDLWEEINIIEKGGNYGWSIREGKHPFGPKGVEARPDLIDPIWEYHHDVGKSITGGMVYRGKELPMLEGAYLYADYVSLKLWALWYDPATKRVTANRELKSPGVPVMSFGEDEDGEIYMTTFAANGQGLRKIHAPQK